MARLHEEGRAELESEQQMGSIMTPYERAMMHVGLREPPRDYRKPLFLTDPEKARDFQAREDSNARKHLPKWAYNRSWLNFYALDLLPSLIHEMGVGPAICVMHPPDHPKWWPAHEPGHVIMIKAKDRWEGRQRVVTSLCIDLASGYWCNCPRTMQGPDLISLYEKRFNISPAKAAWRIARTCGLKRPLPW